MKAILLSLTFLASCSYFISSFEGEDYAVIGMSSDNLSLLFSHNIAGETHPCGCRSFPLGGLPQVAGKMQELKETGSEIFYVDTGDTFFPTNRLTLGMENSQKFAAKNLAKGLAQLGLRYHVPGDQDFSAGVSFYGEIMQEAGLTILAANIKDDVAIKHKKWIVLERGPHKVFLVGLSDPALLGNPEAAALFGDPASALTNVLKEIKDAGWDSESPYHRLLLLSHSGYEQDEQWAKQFPQFEWVIGSHSQKFIRKPLLEGKTKIVQVLSQNHYLGEIKFALDASKASDQYSIHEVHESLAQKLSPNPYEAFIQAHKTEMTRLQEKEQAKQSIPTPHLAPMASAKTCIECHQPQADKWHSTAHSVAYATLINANEAKNLGCVKCHSLGLGDERGFTNTMDMTTFEDDKEQAAYWAQVQDAFKNVGSIRELPPKRIEKLSKNWLALDEKHGVTRQMANVQCLNCHDQHPDHPFHIEQARPSRQEKLAAMKTKCLSCHDSDQSPEWYHKLDNGLPGAVNDAYLDKKMQEVGCPKLEETGL